MNRIHFFIISAIIPFIGIIFSCGSYSAPTTPSQPQFYGSDLQASHEESEIILNSSSDVGVLSVYVDGVLKQTMIPRDSIKLIVSNGQHTVTVDWLGKDGDGKNVPFKGEPLYINAQSMQYVYSISLPALLGGSATLLVGRNVRLTPISTNPLSGRLATNTSKGILGATIRASEHLIPKLPVGSIVAVLSISAADKETSDMAIDELEYRLLESKLFKPVNRNQLENIRSEIEYQYSSGNIDDSTQVSLTHGLGANILITGNVSGSGSTQTLTLRALNVETGEYEMAREPF